MPEHDDGAPWQGLGPYGIVPGQRRIVHLDPNDPDLDFALSLLTYRAEGLRLIEAERREAAEGRSAAEQANLYRDLETGLAWLWSRRSVNVPDPLAQEELGQLRARIARDTEIAEARARADASRQAPAATTLAGMPAWVQLAEPTRKNDKWGPLVPLLDYALQTTLDTTNAGVLRRLAAVCRDHDGARAHCARWHVDTGLEVPIPRQALADLKALALEHRRARRAHP